MHFQGISHETLKDSITLLRSKPLYFSWNFSWRNSESQWQMSTLSSLSLALLTLPPAAWWEFKKSLVLLLLYLLLHSSMLQKWEDEKYPSHAMGWLRGFKTLCLLPHPNYKVLLLTRNCERKMHLPFLHSVWATFYAVDCTQHFILGPLNWTPTHIWKETWDNSFN